VADFVLHTPNKSEVEPIQTALVNSLNIIEQVVKGDIEPAMKTLHTQG
jgi:peptidyl-tRNA hydrolase